MAQATPVLVLEHDHHAFLLSGKAFSLVVRCVSQPGGLSCATNAGARHAVRSCPFGRATGALCPGGYLRNGDADRRVWIAHFWEFNGGRERLLDAAWGRCRIPGYVGPTNSE